MNDVLRNQLNDLERFILEQEEKVSNLEDVMSDVEYDEMSTDVERDILFKNYRVNLRALNSAKCVYKILKSNLKDERS